MAKSDYYTVNMPVLPLGMAFVARASQEAGHRVSQVNLMAEEEKLSVLADRIEQDRPDVIGISVRNIDDQCAPRRVTNFWGNDEI